MSKRGKLFRAWKHLNPDGDAKSAFDFAYNHRKNRIAELELKLDAEQEKNLNLYGSNLELEAELDGLREERRWIPVGERLPEEGEVVIVPLLFEEVQSAKLVDGVWCEPFGKAPILNAARGNMKFQKWAKMPLPEPPQQDTQPLEGESDGAT